MSLCRVAIGRVTYFPIFRGRRGRTTSGSRMRLCRSGDIDTQLSYLREVLTENRKASWVA